MTGEDAAFLCSAIREKVDVDDDPVVHDMAVAAAILLEAAWSRMSRPTTFAQQRLREAAYFVRRAERELKQ